MTDILTAIEALEDMRHLKPATPSEVRDAEQALGLRFAEDYREYTLTYGVISARGAELTGVTSAKRLDVVEVTKRERELNPQLPDDYYVIENLAVDGVIALQDGSGAVYLSAPGRAPVYACASLAAYLEKAAQD